MRFFRGSCRAVAVAAAVGAAAVGCSGGPDILSPGERDGGADAANVVAATPTVIATPEPLPTGVVAPTPAATRTPLPTPSPPMVEVDAVGEVRAELGSAGVRVQVDVDVPAGAGPVSIRLEGAPDGVENGVTWRPALTGTWRSEIVVVDRLGRTTRRPMTFVARHRPSPDALVALGDSVASGHGLELTDYLGGDDCFRSTGAYPHLVAHILVDTGPLPAGSTAAVVACSGADLEAVHADEVGGGRPAWSADGADLSQLDWALRANPAVITLTIGINDIGFVDPGRLVIDGGLDRPAFDRRLATMRERLTALVAALVDGTDATVVVTGYHDPTAPVPQGVDGCPAGCFAAITAEAVEAMNGAIASSLPDHPRVRFVDLATVFEGHGAPNGVGLDSARAGEGVMGRLLGGVFEGIHPYCARGHDQGTTSWINPVDCVHPDPAGHQAIAVAVAAALTTPEAARTQPS